MSHSIWPVRRPGSTDPGVEQAAHPARIRARHRLDPRAQRGRHNLRTDDPGFLDSEPVEVEEPTCRFTLADAEAFPETPLAPTSRPEDPAYILFTSGSTGVPKGVAITHANVKAFADWATRQFGMTHSDRNSSHPPFHFDLSTLDIYGTFAVGAELHLVPAELESAADEACVVHRGGGTDAMGLGSVAAHLHGEVRRGAAGGLFVAASRALLWRGAADDDADLLDAACPSGDVHEPVRPKLKPRSRVAITPCLPFRVPRTSRFRSALHARARSCSFSTTS